MAEYSVNEDAERVVGRRDEGWTEDRVPIPFDEPCELGYWCPVCRVPPLKDDDNFDERLTWSEYNGFLWCSVCNKDYPSALCVPLEGEKRADYVNVGIDDAIKVYLSTVEQAVLRAKERSYAP